MENQKYLTKKLKKTLKPETVLSPINKKFAFVLHRFLSSDLVGAAWPEVGHAQVMQDGDDHCHWPDTMT